MASKKGKRHFLPPSSFRDSTRGKRERFNNRNKTLDRKVLEMHKKCRAHAIKIVQHPRTGELDVFDTRKGSGVEWPPALHSFLAMISPARIQGPDDFAKPSQDEGDESDLASSYRSTSLDSDMEYDPDCLLSTTEESISIASHMSARSKPKLGPLSPTIGGPFAEMTAPQRLIKKEPGGHEMLDYRSSEKSPSRVVCTPKRSKLLSRPRTPPQYRLGPLSPTLLRSPEHQR